MGFSISSSLSLSFAWDPDDSGMCDKDDAEERVDEDEDDEIDMADVGREGGDLDWDPCNSGYENDNRNCSMLLTIFGFVDAPVAAVRMP